MRSFPVFIFLLIVTCQTSAQSKGVDSFINAYVKKEHFSGTILIQQKGKVHFHKSFGKANIPFEVPNRNETIYKIASITKLFTSVLIMQLHEQGKIDLEQKIKSYLPGYTGEGAEKVTIRQLLNNTSGMVNIDTISSIESALKNGLPVYQKPYSTDDLLKKFCSDTLTTEPGKVFSYNNAEYIILGKIIEQVTGKSYVEVLNENILQPLKMKYSGLLYQHNIIPGLADTYFYRDDLKKLVNDLPVYIENWYAAGAMYSTSQDLLKFCQALFGSKLLKQESLNMMFVSGLNEYGFGLWVYKDYAINKINYTILKRPGQIMGAQSMLFHIQEKDATIILLSNTASTSLDEFAAQIADHFIQ
jgi:D-alanyl-D-alanine carboxypeptidase